MYSELYEKYVETQQRGFDELDRVSPEVRNDVGVRDNSEDRKDDHCEKEAEEIQEPHPDLLDHEGHHEEDYEPHTEDDQREEVVERAVILVSSLPVILTLNGVIILDVVTVGDIVKLLSRDQGLIATLIVENLNDEFPDVERSRALLEAIKAGNQHKGLEDCRRANWNLKPVHIVSEPRQNLI